MTFAIIAAGEGSRLLAEGVDSPKPLVNINGEFLIDRLIRVFLRNNADDIVVICNTYTDLVSNHLEDVKRTGLGGNPVPLRFIKKSTPSSMHSFFELSALLNSEPFILTTVDTIFQENEFSSYVDAFVKSVEQGYDGMMGVTGFVDDEKPLYVGTDSDMNITGFYDNNDGQCNFISGGIYGLTHRSLATLNRCMERGESRMRNFQRALVSEGHKLKAYNFSTVFDIDHASDIVKAERFLMDTQK